MPVNPTVEHVLGEVSRAWRIPGPVDAVEAFRRSEEVPPLVEAAVRIGAKVVWMQEGIGHEEAARAGRI